MVRPDGDELGKNTRQLFGDETAIIREMAGDALGSSVLELGCGANRVVEGSIGVDRVPFGELIPHLDGQISAADLVGDIQTLGMDSYYEVIIAKHVLEHLVDPLEALENWQNLLETGGRLIVSCPNEEKIDGIGLNSEHCHVFTPDSLSRLGTAAGLKATQVADSYDTHSFTIAFERGPKCA